MLAMCSIGHPVNDIVRASSPETCRQRLIQSKEDVCGKSLLNPLQGSLLMVQVAEVDYFALADEYAALQEVVREKEGSIMTTEVR